MEALVWSSNDINFRSIVTGTTVRRKLSFTVGHDITLYMNADEIEPMIAALTEGFQLISDKIAEDERARALNEQP